jgi:hypothetical protein
MARVREVANCEGDVTFSQHFVVAALFSRESGGIAGTIRAALFNGMAAKTSFRIGGVAQRRSVSQF